MRKTKDKGKLKKQGKLPSKPEQPAAEEKVRTATVDVSERMPAVKITHADTGLLIVVCLAPQAESGPPGTRQRTAAIQFDRTIFVQAIPVSQAAHNEGFRVFAKRLDGQSSYLPVVPDHGTLEDLLQRVSSSWKDARFATVTVNLRGQHVTDLKQPLSAYGFRGSQCFLVLSEVPHMKLKGGMDRKGQPRPQQQPPVSFSSCQGWCSVLTLNRNATSRSDSLSMTEQENSLTATEQGNSLTTKEQELQAIQPVVDEDVDELLLTPRLEMIAQDAVKLAKYNTQKQGLMQRNLGIAHSLVARRVKSLADSRQQGFEGSDESELAVNTIDMLLPEAMGRFSKRPALIGVALVTLSTIQNLLLLLRTSTGVDLEKLKQWSEALNKHMSPKVLKSDAPISTMLLLQFHLQTAVQPPRFHACPLSALMA